MSKSPLRMTVVIVNKGLQLFEAGHHASMPPGTFNDAVAEVQ